MARWPTRSRSSSACSTASRNVDASNAIYIGDQGTDVEAARKAKVPFGAVRWGYATIEALRQHNPEHEFDSVPALAMKLLSRRSRVGGNPC